MADDEKIFNEEERRRLVADLNLMDDILCSAVMEHRDACEYLISALLGRKITLVEHKTQFSIRNIEKHSIVIDVLVKDEDGKLYDVEVNTGEGGFHERRLRYYNAAIDWSYLDKGKQYSELPELYLLYITTEDPFRLNKNHYEVVQSLKGLDVEYSDGVHIHYFNTKVKDDKNQELTELLEYLADSDPRNTEFGALSKTVNYYKVRKEGVEIMCKKVEDYAKKYAKEYGAEQRNEGLIEGKLEMVKNMIDLGYKKSEALKCAGLDDKTYNKYLAKQ